MAAKPPSAKKPAGPPTADRINARAAKDRQFLKRALRDPGLRSKLDPKYLGKPQQAQRALNVRLNAPITPGSSTTERDLAHAATAATTVKFGPSEHDLGQQLGVAQQTQRDTGSFYDQYQAQLAQHTAKVEGYQAGGQQALAQIAAGITGLSSDQAVQSQQAANQQAGMQGVAPAGNLLPDANAAAGVRQALIGSFQAQQASQGATANTYADTQARVVAPGQKLAAQAQAAGRTRDVRKSVSDLKTQEGAFNESFRDQRRQDEFKNILAASTLSGNQQNMAADNAIAGANATTAAGRVTETNRHNRAAEANAAAGTKSRADAAAGKINQYGYTTAAFAALSTAERQKIIKDFKAGGGKPKPGAGQDWKPTAAQSKGRSQVTSLKGYAQKAKAGQSFVAGHGRQQPVDRHAAAQKIQQSVAAPDDPILVTAALDAVYDGHISPATVKALIKAGYKPSAIAQALGVPTGRQPRAGSNIPSGKV